MCFMSFQSKIAVAYQDFRVRVLARITGGFDAMRLAVDGGTRVSWRETLPISRASHALPQEVGVMVMAEIP